jgi:DNA-binding SARP family transcriptional activator
MTFAARQLSAQQLREKGADVRLIFLHPNFTQQHALLSELLHDTVYVRLSGNHLTTDELTAQIQKALDVQSARLSDVPTLVLDEADRVSANHFVGMIRELLAQMPSGRIVVFSRSLPPDLLDDGELRGKTHFIPAIESMMLWDYAQRDSAQGALLEVRALGAGRVQVNGQPITAWDGILPRSLFFYLVDRGMVTRAEIFQTFWPNLNVKEATNVFHVTKRKISEVLGTDLTVYWSGFYHVSSRIQVSYDVSTFTQMAQDSAIADLEDSIKLLEDAIALYRGDFLTALDASWVTNRRHDLIQSYGDALIGLAKSYERVNNPQRSLVLYLRAASTNRQREDIAFNIMRLSRELGFHRDALTVYERMEDELRKSLKVAPGRQLQELAQVIRNEIL